MTSLALLSLFFPSTSTPIVDLPFETNGGRVYVSTQLEGETIPMVLDSGAGVTLIDSEVAKRLKVETGASIPVGGAGEKPVMGNLLPNTVVRLGGGKAESKAFLALPLGELTQFEGRPILGILGSDLFEHYVVEIDYPASRVRLYDPATYVTAATTRPLTIRRVGRIPQTDIIVDVPGLGSRPAIAMIDTGASGGFVATAKFGQANNLAAILPPGPVAPLAGGVGGLTQGRYLRLNSIRFGDSELKSPVGTLTLSEGGATGTKTSYDVLIGAEALRRFVVTFDYKKNQMWLTPGPALGDPFPVDQSGLLLRCDPTDLRRFWVYDVVPTSPAVEAGLMKGDEVLSVNGVSLVKSNLDAARKLFRSPGAPLKVKIRRGNQELEKTVVLRPMV